MSRRKDEVKKDTADTGDAMQAAQREELEKAGRTSVVRDAVTGPEQPSEDSMDQEVTTPGGTALNPEGLTGPSKQPTPEPTWSQQDESRTREEIARLTSIPSRSQYRESILPPALQVRSPGPGKSYPSAIGGDIRFQSQHMNTPPRAGPDAVPATPRPEGSTADQEQRPFSPRGFFQDAGAIANFRSPSGTTPRGNDADDMQHPNLQTAIMQREAERALAELKSRTSNLERMLKGEVSAIRWPYTFPVTGSKAKCVDTLITTTHSLAEHWQNTEGFRLILSAISTALEQLDMLNPEPDEQVRVLLDVGPRNVQLKITVHRTPVPGGMKSWEDYEWAEDARLQREQRGEN